MKPVWQVERALELAEAGFNNCQIGREIGVDRRTVSDWVRGRTRTGHPHGSSARASISRGPTCPRCPGVRNRARMPTHTYAYLLGLYLGDGLISAHPRGVFRLRIFLDRAHPIIVRECEAAMSLLAPTGRASVYRHTRVRMDEVNSFSQHWPHLFPQHGAGPKHKRKIAFEPWQQRIVERYPGRLLRGLIHSDGCRVTNTIRHPKKTYSYPRYFFSNRSHDIQRIFCNASDRLEIAWRQDGPWNISVARREAVAIMDRHVGPKR